jgi:hypothetical protein
MEWVASEEETGPCLERFQQSARRAEGESAVEAAWIRWAVAMKDAAESGALSEALVRQQVRDEQSAVALLRRGDVSAKVWLTRGARFEGLGWRVDAFVEADTRDWGAMDESLAAGRDALRGEPDGFAAFLAQMASRSLWAGDAEACARVEAKWLPFRSDLLGAKAWRGAFDRSRLREAGVCQEARLLVAAWERAASPNGIPDAWTRRAIPSVWAQEANVAARDPQLLRSLWAAWERQPGSGSEAERFKWLERGADALRSAICRSGSDESAIESARFLLGKGWSQSLSEALESACRENIDGSRLFLRLEPAGFDVGAQPGRLARASVESGLETGAPQWAQERGALFAQPAEGGPGEGESALMAVEAMGEPMDRERLARVKKLREWTRAAVAREQIAKGLAMSDSPASRGDEAAQGEEGPRANKPRRV